MISQGAGAGYGDLLERDPVSIIKDIEEGLISHGVAERLYKVKFDSNTLAINFEATKAARDQERKDRISRGVPFKKFIQTWNKPTPPSYLQ
ncbi:acetone carboxylase subunit alpha, partial [Acinetobacter baumannii]